MFLICMIYLMLPGGSRVTCRILDTIPGVDLRYTDPAQNLVTAGQDFLVI